MSKLSDNLDRLAEHLLEEALSAEPPKGTDRLAVFKAVAAYRVGLMRKSRPEEPEDGETFADLVKGLQSPRADGANDGR